ncbi:c-type cytochrome biogenesis protein CcmI [Roseibium limicola]|nr:c-type cytochrome biogenesis protein CcmI [Roseibium limicola]
MPTMIFWIAIAALTAAAALSVLVPLTRTRSRPESVPENASVGIAAPDLDQDAEVYRAQLEELQRDRVRGLIDDQAFDAARTEIARRLLAAEDARTRREASAPASSRVLRRAAVLAALVFLPAVTLGMYLMLGSPDQPDSPLIARLQAPVEGQSVGELVARVERHLAQNPQDGKGWEVIAPVYMRLNRPEEAARAYDNVIRLLGSSATRQTDMGEALAAANNGIVSAAAQAAFEAAVELDADAVKPRFFLAIALAQDGNREAAVAAWRKLLDGADETESWVPVARAELAKLTGATAALAQPAAPGQPGPDAAAVAEAAQMSDADRSAMIEGMVSGLKDRLRGAGGSLQDWQRLLRAQMVLGREAEARDALLLAREDLAEDEAALAQINALATSLGL